MSNEGASDGTPLADGQVLWSLEDRVVGCGYFDLEGEWCSAGYVRVDLAWIVWTVEKVTPRGAWILQGRRGDGIRGARRWVSHDFGRIGKKIGRTQAEAKELAVCRRKWHVKMCTKRLRVAEQRLTALERAAPKE